MRTATARITYAWAAASALTITSWLLGAERGHGHASASTPITIAVLTIAFIKGFCVTNEFMEVRTAPRWLKRGTTGWLVVVWAAIVAISLY